MKLGLAVGICRMSSTWYLFNVLSHTISKELRTPFVTCRVYDLICDFVSKIRTPGRSKVWTDDLLQVTATKIIGNGILHTTMRLESRWTRSCELSYLEYCVLNVFFSAKRISASWTRVFSWLVRHTDRIAQSRDAQTTLVLHNTTQLGLVSCISISPSYKSRTSPDRKGYKAPTLHA